MHGYRKYFTKKIIWFILTFIIAFVLNFFLPRMMPADPVASITAKMVGNGAGVTEASAIKQIYESFQKEFGTDKPIMTQFAIYMKKTLKGDFGVSFSRYPRKVADIVRPAIGWSIALLLPSIVVGWLLGNVLGALAAYIRGSFDKIILPVFIFINGIPAFGLSYILLLIFAVTLKIMPAGGLYDYDMLPNFSWDFVASVIKHYQLPFWSNVIIFIGGDAIGMRSMSIYELNSDYVKYSRLLGIKDRKIVSYVFRNAMLPQVTGLALSLGLMVGGNLVVETVFSYPGLGSVMFKAISSSDYPLISATTLIISMMVLIASFAIDIIYGFIDPRVKAAQFD